MNYPARPTALRWRGHATPAMALTLVLAAACSSTPLRADKRIADVPYRADRVITVHGQTNVQTMIEFAEDERIENIAVGDSAAWQVTPNKRGNLLFLKPLSARAFTNMTVVTDQRRYLFDLLNLGPRDRPVYVMRFAYPKRAAPSAAPGGGGADATVSTVEMAVTPPPPPPPPPPRYTGWRSTGDRRLLPKTVSDDGQFTYMTWTPGSDLPAILSPGPDGQDGPVNFTSERDTIIIEGVAPRYVLRTGKATATVVRSVPLHGPAAAVKPDPVKPEPKQP